MASLSMDNPVFASFAFYMAVLAIKMVLMSFLTAKHRITRQIFANTEDCTGKTEPTLTDPDVERIRRAHRNDIENIPIFLLVALGYIMTGPAPDVALWHFRVFTFARVLHTIIYLNAVPQPSRFILALLSWFTTVSMAVQVIMFTMA